MNRKHEDVFSKYAIHCSEQWQANAILKFAFKNGYTKWHDGEPFTSGNRWERHKERTAYRLSKGTYNTVEGYTGSKIEVIEYSDACYLLNIPLYEEGYRRTLEEDIPKKEYNFIVANDFSKFLEGVEDFKAKNPEYEETNLIQYRGNMLYFMGFRLKKEEDVQKKTDNGFCEVK